MWRLCMHVVRMMYNESYHDLDKPSLTKWVYTHHADHFPECGGVHIRLIKADLVCLQEDAPHRYFMEYAKVAGCSTGVTIYVRYWIRSRILSAETVIVSTQANDNPHTNVVNFDGIIIANVHLCGGRYDDVHYKTFLTEKADSIKHLLGHDPVIIVGDFNGDPSPSNRIHALR